MATLVKTEIDVEMALRWAWRDKFSKRKRRPPKASGTGFNDFQRQPQRIPQVSRGKAGERALRGWFGPEGARAPVDRPRNIMMIGTFHPKTLVTVHAAGASRPDWRDDEPKPSGVLSTNGKNAKVEGRCEARDRYSPGSYCPLEWDPSSTSVILRRPDYVVWWEALDQLARAVELQKFILLPPRAAASPWFGEIDVGGNVIHVQSIGPLLHLPLVPKREPALAPYRRRLASKRGPGEQAHVGTGHKSASLKLRVNDTMRGCRI